MNIDLWFEGSFLGVVKPSLPRCHDLDAPLPSFSYSDQRLNAGEAYIIFGREEEDLNSVYSDRLWEWDYVKAKAANASVQAAGVKINTPRYCQEFLRAYYDAPDLELVCIKGGYNAATLYNFYVYGYRKIASR